MNAIIVGCGRVGAELALILSEEGHNVSVIDKKTESFKRLGDTFNGLCIEGNGFDLETLGRAEIKNADAVVVVTNGDNTNIMASQVAKKIFRVPKVIARLYDWRRAEIYQRLGLDIISGTTLVASLIRDKLIESKFSGYLIEAKGMGTLEIVVSDKFVGKKVTDLNIENQFIIANIIKKSGPYIPGPATILEKGDVIVGIVRVDSLKKVKKLFDLKE